MRISDLSLKRPVLAIVLNIIIVLFGVIGFRFLGVRDYPAIDPPNINVRTAYPGANADVIESQITEPLEKAINGVAGVKNMTSSSSQGTSNINVEFELGYNLEEAANDVRDKVSQSIRALPEDLESPPVVTKADASSDPILSMTVQSDNRNQLQITEYANNNLIERLQTIPGVSNVIIWGEKKYAMRIWLSPEKMLVNNVTANDIQQALRRENVELPSGKIAGHKTELTVRTFGRLSTEEDFRQLIVQNTGGRTVVLNDVAEVVLGPENEETILKEKGIPMIALAVVPQPGSNYVAIADEFYQRLESIQKELPSDIHLDIALDQTKFVRKSIMEVKETLILAFALVVLIIFLFFRDWIIAIRPLIDIPVCLIGAFFIMYMAGFTINVLTLLAIVLATGLVVDDGIVVTENIFKKMERGMNKYRAAREGSAEIYFAVISTSITLAVVFLPIIFLQGFVGRLFREFGIVVAGAVLISAFVSLTLTPVLNIFLSRKNSQHHGWFYRVTEPFFIRMEAGYHRVLSRFMQQRWIAFVLVLICTVSIYFLFHDLQSELAPLEDRSQFRLQVTAPEGTSFDGMDASIDKLTRLITDSVPEHQVVISVTAPGFIGSGAVNTGFVRTLLTEPNERKRTQQEIVDMMNKHLPRYNEVKAFPIQEQTISVNRRGGLPVQFVLQNNDFEKIKSALPRFMEAAGKSAVFAGVDADLKFNKPELRITIDRLRASTLGVSTADIAETLQLALTNRRFGYFIKEGKQYQVMGQVTRGDRDDPKDLKNLYVRSSAGQLYLLDEFVNISEETTPPTLYHFNRYKSATISAGLAPGKTIGDGIQEMEALSKTILDESFTTSLAGPSRDFKESSGNTSFAFLLALVLIFLVLAAQFESFIDPIIIMITVPLAMAGALFSLWIFDQTINIFSQIGMIMLIGLVTKNGILIVEFANQKKEQGMDRFHAVIEAATMRLRPILMTSLAMSLGALPLALSLGAASTSRIPLGIVIVGGILFALFLTLLVIPAMYSFFSSKKIRNREKEEQEDSNLLSNDAQ